MTAIETAAAGMTAGQLLTFHQRDGAEGYTADIIDSQSNAGPGSAFAQMWKLEYDFTPLRGHIAYLVQGAHSASDTTIAIDGSTRYIPVSATVRFANHASTYTVQSFDGSILTLTSGLTDSIADNAAVSVTWDGRRIYFFGHAHQAATKTWPCFSCYRFHENDWVELPAIHDLTMDNTNADRIFVYGDLFHTCTGTGIDVANQIFYRWGPGVDPEIISRVNIDEDDPQDIGAFTGVDYTAMGSHWGFEPGFTMGGSLVRNAIEFFPEADSLVAMGAIADRIVAKRSNLGASSSWVEKHNSGTWNPGNNNGDGMILLNNPIRKKMLVGVSQGTFNDEGCLFWEMDSDFVLTELDDSPIDIAIPTGANGLIWIDPTNGDYEFLVPQYGSEANPFFFYRLRPDQSTGNQWIQQSSSAFPVTMAHDSASTYILGSNAAATLHDLGVVMICGGSKVRLYKPTANTRAADGMTTDEQFEQTAAAVGAIRFGDDFIPKYTWNQAEAAVDGALAAAVSGLTWYPHSEDSRADNEGNILIHNYAAHADAPRSNSGDGVCMPVVVTDVTFKGQPGSLRFKWPNQVGQSRGILVENIDGTHGTTNGSNLKFIGPGDNALGRNLYIKYALRLDTTSLASHRRQLDSTHSANSCTTPAPNSTTVNLNNAILTGAFEGKKVYVNWISGQNWKPGFYTVVTVNSSTQCILNQSPTLVDTQGTNGVLEFQGEDGDNTPATKLDIIHGNAPEGSSASTNVEFTSVVDTDNNYLAQYEQQGAHGFVNQVVGPMIADTWHELAKEIKIRPASRDWYTAGAGSLVLKSDTFTVVDSIFVPGTKIFISGYGPRSYAVGASPWVPGWYTIDSVNVGNNSWTLTSSPTPSATGTSGEVYVPSPNLGAFLQYAKNRIRTWVDGLIAVDASDSRCGFEVVTNHGVGQMSLSTAANDADATVIHSDAYQYFSHFLFGRQPFAKVTASMASESEPEEPAHLRRPRRVFVV